MPDDYWMGLAFMVAAASRNPDRQEGAVIVGPQNTLLSQGYDSPPKCMRDGNFFRHAEKVALNSSSYCAATMYITHTPCSSCLLDIVASEIKRIIYFKTEPLDSVCSEIVRQSYIQLVEFRGSVGWLRDHMIELEDSDVF